MNATLDQAHTRDLEAPRLGMARAHAKAILFGEHAVVYGAPALSIPVPELTAWVHAELAPGIYIDSDLYTGPAENAPDRLGPVSTAITATLAYLRELGGSTGSTRTTGTTRTTGSTGTNRATSNGRARSNGRLTTPRREEFAGAAVRIRSDIPPDRGLGSSAAVAAAIAGAVADAYGAVLNPEARFEIAQEAERRAHGNPSGLDARTVLADAPIRFESGRVTRQPIGQDLTFVLADSGVPGSTATAVAGVRAMRDTDLGTVDRIIERLAGLARDGADALGAGDAASVGAGMTAAHEELRRLGVSIPELNSLAAAACAGGALGAKLTGGGIGGCVLALAESPHHADDLARALRSAGARGVVTTTVRRTG